MEPLYLYGCRHDILGHYLKAIGLLRVLAQCADKEQRDSEAEGWWDLDKGCFCLQSSKYNTFDDLVDFLARYYHPTPLFVVESKGQPIVRSTSKSLTDYLVDAASQIGARVAEDATAGEALSSYRDGLQSDHADIVDAISAPRFSSGADNPLWLGKGRTSGKGHIWSTFAEYVDEFEKLRRQKSKSPLHHMISAAASGVIQSNKSSKGKGTPFFPDAIKAYNIGAAWVEEKYPFNALDYILSVEGAFAMRGGVARTLGANSKRFAAFPFVFDSGEDMVDDGNEIKGTSSSLWFPLWSRRAAYNELSSFITDAQARLHGKEARFSAEFVRALNSQGVDAGFSGWQEFRFKMKGSRVPWITTGRYVAATQSENATQLNRALDPLDESRFLDQFDFRWKGNKADPGSPHPVRAELNAAMENAALDPTAHHCMELLASVFRASRQITISKSFREKLQGNGRFFDALPSKEWEELLHDLEVNPEFRIARAVASIPGFLKQHEQNKFSQVGPMLASLLPLKQSTLGRWYLPSNDDRSNQAVWTGTDLCYDLAAVLQRRYLDSLKDDLPALCGLHQARLDDVMAFINRELNDQLIGRWIEALSLIDWHSQSRADGDNVQGEREVIVANEVSDKIPIDPESAAPARECPAIPVAYAALRTLLELECAWQGKDRSAWKKRRSQLPITLLCQRSASNLPMAVSEALRWISVWGIPNPWGANSRREKEILSGRYIVRLEHHEVECTDTLIDPARLAAAVCIPLAWEDQWQLRRCVSLPFSV